MSDQTPYTFEYKGAEAIVYRYSEVYGDRSPVARFKFGIDAREYCAWKNAQHQMKYQAPA